MTKRGSERALWTTLVLWLAALTSVGAGLGLVASPVAFRSSFGLVTEQNAPTLSEIRAPGGALVTLGVVMALGALRCQWRRTALVVSTWTFLGYAGARLLSLGLDGFPSIDLVLAAALEGVIGLAALSRLLVTGRARGD